ncbi:MAG: M20 family metallopeptidase, partial [Bacteroidales bacterium]
CGHDIHVASLLGTLLILNDLKDRFSGTIKAIFQPSEEEYDGGAKFMIEAGVLANPEVNVIFGQHVTPGLEAGTIGLCEGPFMASTDEIHLTIHGKGGHAALLNEIINPILIGVDFLHELYAIIEKIKPLNIPTVLSFGKFTANGLPNLVPDKAEIAGTLRTFDESWRETVLALIEEIAQKTVVKEGASCTVDIRRGYPVLCNEIETTRRVRQYAEQYLGKEAVLSIPPRMTAEDFAYFLQKKPGTFYRLGVSNQQKGITQKLHTAHFQIEEEAIRTAIGLMSWITINELKTIK